MKTYLAKRGFATSVYVWQSMPRLGPKATELKQQLVIPKGSPKKIEAFDNLNVKNLQIGLRHSAAITEDGKLFMFGSGNWGVLGNGTENDIRFDKPQQVEYFAKRDKKVVDVALGEYHTAALTEDGSIYTWGYGGKATFFNWMVSQEVGGLGHGDKTHHFTPKKVEFFEKNGIKVKSVHAGLYHTIVLTQDGDLYSWGRGLYGVLGNASNKYELSPCLNEEIQAIKSTGKQIEKVECADEYTGVLFDDGSLYVWGKNDRGQLGVGSGIGIDMVESENVPVQVKVIDDKDQAQNVKDFHPGQNTMMIQDDSLNVYKVGLKLDYSPKQVNLFNDEFLKEDVTQLACGRKHYVVLNKHNQLMVWGNVFSQKPTKEVDGFGLYFGDSIFDGGKVKQLSLKYSVYGALVESKNT